MIPTKTLLSTSPSPSSSTTISPTVPSPTIAHFLSKRTRPSAALQRAGSVKPATLTIQQSSDSGQEHTGLTDEDYELVKLPTGPQEDYHSVSQHQPSRALPSRPSRERLYIQLPSNLPSPVFTMSGSDTPPSVFDQQLDLGDEDVDVEGYTDPTQPSRGMSAQEAQGSYDLKPPPPQAPLSNIELLADRLFSLDHLKVIMRDPSLNTRFNTFLNKYRPASVQSMRRYLDTQKALSAIDYANAIAEQLAPGSGSVAASLEEDFEARSHSALGDLINDALPGYVTHRLVQIITETLVKEITGQNTPIMRELVPSLAEVYCLTDPSLPDNPIVYASEEFYRTSQYGRDYVIGRNCRFLQGPKSSGASVNRLIEALAEGQEICETILNYRRDGSPFMNLLMIAPLYDNKGTVRYFIGAQIDVNGLIEGGRGLESFERLLSHDRRNARYGDNPPMKTPQAALAELSSVLDELDMEVVRGAGTDKRPPSSGSSTPNQQTALAAKPTSRRYIGMDNPDDRNLWPAPHLGPSGRLPGVFQNYLLVRPYPSLRITFTSPALRIPGLLQARLLDRIGGPPQIREGIQSAMASGVGVTAKVTWLSSNTIPTHSANHSTASSMIGLSRPTTSQREHLYHTSQQTKQQQNSDSAEGKPRWIHCTPLLGSDEKVGVWMVIMVESENITGAINVAQPVSWSARQGGAEAPKMVPRDAVTGPKYAAGGGGRLYQEYLRREGRSDSLLHVGAVEGGEMTSPPRGQGPQQQQQHRGGTGASVSSPGSVRARGGPGSHEQNGYNNLGAGGGGSVAGSTAGKDVRSGQYMGHGAGTSGQYAMRDARSRGGEEGFSDF